MWGKYNKNGSELQTESSKSYYRQQIIYQEIDPEIQGN
jgi:hypothetical protein